MKKKKQTYPIDFAARYYPLLATRKTQSLFRLSAVLEEDADPMRLEQAVADTLPRFPTFNVRLRMGYSWYYLEDNSARRPKVTVGDVELLSPINKKANNYFEFRFMVSGKLIAVDFAHFLADGTGAVVFFKTVLNRYFELGGYEGRLDGGLNIDDVPTEGEIEDGFARYYKPFKFRDVDLNAMKGVRPHRIEGEVSEQYRSNTIAFLSKGLIDKAHELDCTLTVLIAAMMALAIMDVSKSKKYPLAMMVPVNFRKIFPSATVRNFVLFTRLMVDRNREWTLESLVQSFKDQLKSGVTKDSIQLQISTTVRTNKTFIWGASPLWFKWLALRIGRLILRSRQTIIISNLGKLTTEHSGVEKLMFNVNVSKNAPLNMALISFGDNTLITFTSCLRDDDVPHRFAAMLGDMDIDVDYRVMAQYEKKPFKERMSESLESILESVRQGVLSVKEAAERLRSRVRENIKNRSDARIAAKADGAKQIETVSDGAQTNDTRTSAAQASENPNSDGEETEGNQSSDGASTKGAQTNGAQTNENTKTAVNENEKTDID